MASKPKTDHARALSEFIKGRITRDEYKMCCVGLAFVHGNNLWKVDDEMMGFEVSKLGKQLKRVNNGVG